MEIYKQASREQLRFQTERGSLNVEQLWSLPLNELDSLAVSLEEKYKESGKKSFLIKKSVKDKQLKLKFDIVVDILNSLVEERDEMSANLEAKKHNEKIDMLIVKKQENELEELSIAELEKLRK